MIQRTMDLVENVEVAFEGEHVVTLSMWVLKPLVKKTVLVLAGS